MLDEELLPKNHPLQLYLEELELAERVDDTDDSQAPENPVVGSLSGRVVIRQLNHALSFIHPRLFGFAEYFRQRILENAHSYIAPSDAAVMRHVYHADRMKYMRSSFCLLSLGFILPLSVVLSASSMTMTLFGSLLILPSMSVVLCAMCLHLMYFLLRDCAMKMKSIQTRLRASLTFLHEFDHHSSFGASHLPLVLNQTAWSYPVLQRQLGRCLCSYSEQLIDSSSYLNGQISLLCTDFCCGLSSDELRPLKERVCSKDLTYILHELKMLREVTAILESDFMNKIIGSICFVPIQSVLYWIRVSMLLRSLLRGLRNLQEPLDKLERLRDCLQNGDADSDLSDTQLTVTSGKTDNPDYSTLNSADRLARTLLMHLLVAVKSTRELTTMIGKDCLEKEVTDKWKAVMGHLRCQLNACINTREQLEKLLLPEGSSQDEASPDENDGQQELFTFKSMEEAAARTAIKAQDIDPEDDVLEDVAIGESSPDEDELKVDQQLDEDVIPIVPLHSSVLKELRNVIAYRRLTMQEREQKALRRRAQSSQMHGRMEPAPTEKPNEMCLEPFRESYPEPNLTTMNQNESASIAKDSDCTTPDSDTAIDRFFSVTRIDDDSVLPTKSKLELRRRCSWRAQSAVKKRTNQFRRSNTVHRTGHCLVTANGSPVKPLRPTSPPSRIPLPGLTPLPFSPSIPGIRPSLRLFPPGHSLANALLAQRRKAGYAEEESFVAIGTGEEVLTEPSPPENAHPANGHIHS